MPHFQANKIVILRQEDVPEGYTLKEIYEAMKDKQFPLKFRKGGAGPYVIGQLIRAYHGRDGIVADVGFDPEFKLIFDKELVQSKEEDGVEDLITIVKHLEWVI